MFRVTKRKCCESGRCDLDLGFLVLFVLARVLPLDWSHFDAIFKYPCSSIQTLKDLIRLFLEARPFNSASKNVTKICSWLFDWRTNRQTNKQTNRNKNIILLGWSKNNLVIRQWSIIRPHCLRVVYNMQPIATDVARSVVCVSVCLRDEHKNVLLVTCLLTTLSLFKQ